MNESDGVKSAFTELCANGFRVDGLAPLDLDFFGIFAAALSDAIPLIRESTAAEVEDFFLNEVPDAAFHDAPSGRGGEEDRTLGSDDLADTGLDGGVEFFEVSSTVADGWASHGGVGFWSNIDWSGDEKLRF